MKRLVVLILLCLSSHLNAQDDKAQNGIVFLKGLTWEQVKAKAKQENKYIFVDCYTTWCLPCKRMEKNVFTDSKVGDYFNSKFISIKVQMDKTAFDVDEVKTWHRDAELIKSDYDVSVYPTFLFFSEDGHPIHRASGGYSSEGLIALAKDAFDPKKQYYTLLAQYKPKSIDISEMKNLARTLKYSGEELAQKIAVEYLNSVDEKELFSEYNLKFILEFKKNAYVQEVGKKYISSLKEEDIYTKGNLNFIRSFTTSSSDLGFSIFKNDGVRVDSILDVKGVSRMVVCTIINKEEITPHIIKAKESSERNEQPSWRKIERTIKRKYGESYSGSLIVEAKLVWYSIKNERDKYFKNLVLSMDKYGSDKSAFELNNAAWETFLTSNDTVELKKALAWSDRAVRMGPPFANWIDTYANILYKLGRRKDAIAWQKTATRLEPNNIEFKNNLNLMEQMKPTWPMAKSAEN